MRPLKWWSVLALACLLGLPVRAQEETRRRDLTDGPVNAEQLIEALAPQGPQPRSLGTPKCKFLQSRGVTVKPVADVVALKIEFAYDSAELAPEAGATLKEMGKALTSSRLASCCFQIQGHTDGRGTDEYNQDLSERRARAVVRYLENNFEIDSERLMVEGKGESDPVADNETATGRQKNRRVEIINLGYGQVMP